MVGLPELSTATKVYIASLALIFLPLSSSTQTSIKTSIEVVKALETFASIVTVVPIGIAFPKETLLTEDVTTICSE